MLENFLNWYRTGGPWVLCAVSPDANDMETETLDDLPTALEWVKARNGKKNIYFHVNPTKRALRKKASKLDIASLSWIHVDVDPEPNRDFTAERGRILRKLQEFQPSPSLIIDSGGGYQAFWRLSEPQAVSSDLSVINGLEAYNLQVARLLGGDHCHNIDRIMRLPGTINLPTKRKRNAGRKDAEATIVERSDMEYPLSVFQPAVKVQAPGITLTPDPEVNISGNMPPMGADELREWGEQNGKKIDDILLAIIVTGQHPYEERYPSRSEALFACVSMMVKAGCPDDVIYSIITGPNVIAESVLEANNPDAYAARQIQRARSLTQKGSSDLDEMNEKHAVIEQYCGKCRILSRDMDGSVQLSTHQDFSLRYRNRRVQIGVMKDGTPKTKNLGDWWLEHPQRTTYRTMDFTPEGDVPGVFNMWTGFAVPSRPGNAHQPFLDHVRQNVCAGDETLYNYVMDWLAVMIQKPGQPGQVAIVIRGKRGTGKSVFANVAGMLLGRHYAMVSDSKHLVGAFNAHLRDKVLLFADEAFFAGDKKHESVLKTLVTENKILIEAKGLDAVVSRNYLHLILASNEDWVVPAGLDERRFLVLQMAENRRQDFAYFSQLMKSMEGEGCSNLLHDLLSRDISQYQPGNIPKTSSLSDQQMFSMTPEQQWILSKLTEGRLLNRSPEWEGVVIKDLVYNEYIRDMKDQGVQRRASRMVFWKRLKPLLPGIVERTKTVDYPSQDEMGYERIVKKQAKVVELPKLASLRKYWDKNLGGPYEWLDDEQEDLEIIEETSPF